MSAITLLNVTVHNNPAAFTDPYEFEITFECLENLQKDLEWKLTYVGSAKSAEHDQILDSLLVGPVPVGVNKFVFEADAPNLDRVPLHEILGCTVILLTASYDGREFVRVGYYVNNEYTDPELQAEPPESPIIEKIHRNILAEKPRVTRFAIKWDTEESAPAEFPPDQPEADAAIDDEAAYGADEQDDDDEEEDDDSRCEALQQDAQSSVANNEGESGAVNSEKSPVDSTEEGDTEGDFSESLGEDEDDDEEEEEDREIELEDAEMMSANNETPNSEAPPSMMHFQQQGIIVD